MLNFEKIPNTGCVEVALLHFLLLRGPVRAADVYDPLAEVMKLNSMQRTLKNKEHRSHWQNRVRTARKHLVERSLVQQGPRGIWTLTDKGRDVANKRESGWEELAALV